MLRARLNVHSGSYKTEDWPVSATSQCSAQCCDAVVCLSLLLAAGQTVTPRVCLAVTPSVHISPRETLNPHSTAKSLGCCSVADTPH